MFYMYVHPETLPPGGAFHFRRIYMVVGSTYVYVHTCLEEECRIINQSDWELHISATLPPLLLLSIESTTNLVGHNIFTSIRDRYKNINF